MTGKPEPGPNRPEPATVTVSLPPSDIPMLRAMLEHRGWRIDPDEQPGAGWEARG